jgi:hypothetical protein
MNDLVRYFIGSVMVALGSISVGYGVGMMWRSWLNVRGIS